jgi:4-hydroxy-tetrahydrodipicolinate synthase
MPDIFRGIFPGALTPFDKMGNLLWDDFANECDWMVRAGAHGFIWPIMASEFTVISHHERVQGMKIAVDTIAGRIPVVIGAADTNKPGAVFFAEKAAEAGADAIIALPPWATKMSDNILIEDYYRSLTDASGLPLFIQNVGGQLGSGLSSKLVAELCEKIPLAQYVKEERTPHGHKIAELLELAGPGVKGVFSGAGCMGLIGEYKRGIAGCVPSSAFTDIDSRIWDLLEAGEEEKACEIHNAKLVLENILRSVPLLWGRKTLMVRRGVFSSTASRNQGKARLDEIDLEEMDRGLNLIKPYLRN